MGTSAERLRLPAFRVVAGRIDLHSHDLRHEYVSPRRAQRPAVAGARSAGPRFIVTTERYDNQRPETLFKAARRLETGKSFKNLSRSRSDERTNAVEEPSENDAKLVAELKKEVGVDDGVRTRDFRSHSPALYR
jgi:hypothetical protein